MVYEFDKCIIEKYFLKAENFLFDDKNIYHIKYKNFDVESFDKLNSEMLKNISNKFIVYCLWQGKNVEDLNPKYVGHAKNTISRQRIRAHLTKKNKATGAQLDKVKEFLSAKTHLGITYLIIEPGYMRTSLEEWLIYKHVDILEWNKNK